jgi:sialidase-1
MLATAVSASCATVPSPLTPDAPAVVVFAPGDCGHPIHRIPSAIRLPCGRIVAFAEGRGSLADNGSNDLVMRRSDDNGRTWSDCEVLVDQPGRSINNPCAVHVCEGPHAGRLLVMFQSYPTGAGEHQVQAGLEGESICRTLVIASDDRGQTWSPPRDVTSGTKRPTGVTSVASGPGIGVQLRRGPYAGRLVVPFNEGPFGKWRTYAALSDDGGDSWRMGLPAPDGSPGRGNEVQLVERADGSLLMVSRQFDGARRRKVTRSVDGGESWSPLIDQPELVDPSCMGGIASIDTPSGPRLVVTGPGDERRRIAGTAWISADGGATWPRTVGITDGPFAYSVPVALPAGRLGVLWERDGTGTILWQVLRIEDR